MSWRAIGLTLVLLWSSSAASSSLDVPSPLRQGLEHLRSGRYRHTIETARSLEKSFPGHPLPHLIAAEAYWGMIYCETGHITSREIWNVAGTKASPYDREFFQAVEKALATSQAWRQEKETAALGAFYAGLAQGVQARLFTLREQTLKSGSAGKQMRAALLEAVAKDPALAPDASFGLGAYNYYADVLSPWIKVFRFFLGIPGGDRRAGLEQLQTASQRAALLAPEARYELAHIFGVRENRHSDALPLLQSLSDQYPENALYALATAIQAERAGRKEIAMEYARKAKLAAAGMDDVCRERLGTAAQQALSRWERKPDP